MLPCPPALSVSLSGHPHRYPLFIGDGLFADLPRLLEPYLPAKPWTQRRCLLVSDANVAPLYLSQVAAALESVGASVFPCLLPAGEGSKCVARFQEVLEAALAAGLKRNDVFIALGGGVMGDLVGYAASSYYRGAAFVQLPTTLLAQVDSSVGGKVAINLGSLKNCVGAFYQPNAVVMDTATLRTLPQRERQAGLAEIVKYAFIERSAVASEALESAALKSQWLLPWMHTLKGEWQPHLSTLLQASCYLKAQVVERDERESAAPLDASGRVCLNLGHTFAHAIEAHLDYGRVLHGEAVGWGILAAAALSHALGLLSLEGMQEVRTLLDAFELLQLPQGVSLSDLPSDAEFIHHMGFDKKNQGQQRIRFILPVAPLGTVNVVELDASDASVQTAIATALAALRLALKESC